MPGYIPFIPSRTNYVLSLAIGSVRYLFNTHWNSRDEAWYFDLREEDETPICLGIKVVLGVQLGHTSPHKFFQANMMRAIDTTGVGTDAGFDDLGVRIQVVLTSADEVRNPVT